MKKWLPYLLIVILLMICFSAPPVALRLWIRAAEASVSSCPDSDTILINDEDLVEKLRSLGQPSISNSIPVEEEALDPIHDQLHSELQELHRLGAISDRVYEIFSDMVVVNVEQAICLDQEFSNMFGMYMIYLDQQNAAIYMDPRSGKVLRMDGNLLSVVLTDLNELRNRSDVDQASESMMHAWANYYGLDEIDFIFDWEGLEAMQNSFSYRGDFAYNHVFAYQVILEDPTHREVRLSLEMDGNDGMVKWICR